MSQRKKGVSFTCTVPRVTVTPYTDSVKLTFRELEERALMEVLSGAVNAFNRLLSMRAKEQAEELEGAADATTGLQQDS